MFQKQYHTQIDELIEESVKDMIQLLVAKVYIHLYVVILWGRFLLKIERQKHITKVLPFPPPNDAGLIPLSLFLSLW